jgi:hypothetical protein
MLLSLWTGRKPTLRTYEMVCFYFIGLADEEELLGPPRKTQGRRRLTLPRWLRKPRRLMLRAL